MRRFRPGPGGLASRGMDDRQADARAALGWLAGRVTGVPLLAVGHSEGALYAAELAADGRWPARCCCPPGPGRARRS